MTCIAQRTLNGVDYREKDVHQLNGIHQFSTPENSLCLAGDIRAMSKMRFSDSVTSDFDISSILTRVSGHELNDTSAVNDGLFNILDKISTTGQQLKDELQNAKLREDSLVKEMHELRSKESNSMSLSPIKATPCSYCSGEIIPQTGGAVVTEINDKCEKLQNALLSLEEENMRLNRLLKRLPTSPTSETLAERGKNLVQAEKLELKDKEVEALRDQVGEFQKLLTEAREEVVREKQLKVDLLKKVSSQNQVSVALNTSISEDQLLQLQQKANFLQKQNAEYLERIQNFETKLKLNLQSASTEETYKLRIDDLHNLLVLKEEEISKLKESLSLATKDLVAKDKKAKAAQSKDISKRKEVLLLCDKYEQLKKSVKRLESDLHDSQQKLQEANTKCWALETSFQRTVEENEVLKHQLGLLEGFMMTVKSSNTPRDGTSIVKDYEKLTGKYEELLSLRLREYEKLKSSSRNRKLLKRISAHYQAQEYDKRRHIRKALFHDSGRDAEMMEELMWRRERDMRRLNGTVDNLQTRSHPVQKAPRRLYNHPPDQQFERPYQTNISNYGPRDGSENNAHRLDLQTAPSFPVTNPVKEQLPVKYYPRDTYSHATNTRDDPSVQSADLRANRMTSTPRKKSSPAPRIPSSAASTHLETPAFSQPSELPPERYRSKSASPTRTTLKNENLNDSLNSSGKESQKSVSFCLSPTTHRISNSARGIGLSHSGSNLTPLRSQVTAPKKKVISPVEVLERVKSAYQEEYIRNMDGVGITFLSSKTNQPADSKASVSKSSEASSMCGERYKTISQNLKQFVEKSYPSDLPLPQPSRDYQFHRPERIKSKSPSPKGILKKPKTTTETNVVRRSPSPLLHSDSQRPPVVVREKTPSHFTEYASRINESLSQQDKEARGYSPIEIVDVNPMPIDRDGNRQSLDSSAESSGSNPRTEDVKDGSKMKSDDLRAPVQFARLRKEEDDDSDTVSQSSVSSTTEHIGRFEFLQEMRWSLKNPSFSYQKPVENQPHNEEPTSPSDKNNSGDLGLSARQQEYAEKLVKKYTQSRGENHKIPSPAVSCE